MTERIDDPLEGPRTPRRPTPKKRGRPVGSVSLTPEIQAKIVGLVARGVMQHVAARAAGVAPRTVEDWVARGEGRHPTRSRTRKLRAFARELRLAQGSARYEAEIAVYRDKPKLWLRYAARTTEEAPGWTIPRERTVARDLERQFLEAIEKLDERERREREGPAPAPLRRGRPPGSVSLTEEIHRIVVQAVRAGAFLKTAADLAGVAESTLHAWLARGEGRDRSRPPTTRLRRFAAEVRRAQADARAGAEARVKELDPLHWLRHAARTEGRSEGWSEPRPPEEEQEDLRQLEAYERLIEQQDERRLTEADHGSEQEEAP